MNFLIYFLKAFVKQPKYPKKIGRAMQYYITCIPFTLMQLISHVLHLKSIDQLAFSLTLVLSPLTKVVIEP